MRRTILAIALCCLSVSSASAQDVGMPGVMYSGMIAGGDGGQLYRFDRQDPWLHGQFQRMPAYGGFNTFRPYNYRHVFAQTQIATSVWGAAHGQPYSQQFWNRYRADYLNGNVHSQVSSRPTNSPVMSPVGYRRDGELDRQTPPGTPAILPQTAPAAALSRPVHVYPSGTPVRWFDSLNLPLSRSLVFLFRRTRLFLLLSC